MSATQKKLAVVIPFLNEEENIPLMYDRLTKCMAGGPESLQIIFVDDGSTDGSAAWIANKAREDSRLCLLRLSRNFGHQIAITAGMDYAEADCVAIIDCDLQDPPEVIPEMLKKWREGFEVIYAVRESRAGETLSKKLFAAGFYRMFHRFANVKVPVDTGDFRLVDRKVIHAMRELRELHRFMRGLTSWVGFKQCPVKYQRAARHAGITKYPVWKSLRLAWDAFTSFSGAPLRAITSFGMLISLVGLFVMLNVVIGKLLFPKSYQPGWATLIAIVLFLGGVQLVSIGFVGQYVSRIFEESKKRPLYFVSEVIGDVAKK
jgi:dolichol-phosphate mannosyltransferase